MERCWDCSYCCANYSLDFSTKWDCNYYTGDKRNIQIGVLDGIPDWCPIKIKIEIKEKKQKNKVVISRFDIMDIE